MPSLTRSLVVTLVIGTGTPGCYQAHGRATDAAAPDAARDPRCTISEHAFDRLPLTWTDTCSARPGGETWIFNTARHRCTRWWCWCPDPECPAVDHSERCTFDPSDDGPAYEPWDYCYFATREECHATCRGP